MLKKILVGLGIFIVIILGAAIVLPIIYKDKIVAMVKEEVNKKVNAKVDFGNFNLTLIRSFPNFTISINNLSVIGVAPFAGDTLTAIKELDLTIDVMSVIRGGQIDIKSIHLDQPLFNLMVLKDGKANWDISKPSSSTSTSTEPAKFKVALKEYSINQGVMRYNDASMGFIMNLDNLNHTGSGDFTQDLFILKTNTTIDAMNLWYGNVKYFHNINTKLKVELDMDMANMKFTFKENEISLNELVLGFDGFVAMPKNDITMDLKFDAKKNEFRNFLSLVPGIYTANFKDLKSSGSLSLKGFVKGIYNDKQMPGFGLNVKIQNGKFQYPSLPVAVNNVSLDLDVNNADGIPDHTAIDLNKMHVDLGTEPFDAKLRVRTPVSDADLNGVVKGRVNFANISKIIPLEKGTSITGLMLADLSFNGRMSAIEQKRYQDFKAAGSLSLTDFNYSSKDYKQGFELKQLALTFNPQNVTLNKLVARMGTSDFNATGTLDNLLAYMFKKETLKGSMNLQSAQINLADFKSNTTSTTAVADTTPMALIEVPVNLDFIVTTTIGKLIYDNVTLQSLTGKITIREQAINMENLTFNTLGGAMKMSGLYATKVRKEADMQFSMDIKNFDIQQTVKTFNSVKKMAPIAERASGTFNTTLNLTGKLDEHLQPKMQTLTGSGKLSTMNVVISQFPPLVKVADALKMDQFKQLKVGNTNLSYKFKNGRVDVDPFDVNLAGINTNVKGSSGFDQTIDYTLAMNIPTNLLPSQATSVISGLISQANAKGAKMSMGESIKVNALIGGTVSNPTVKTDLKNAASTAVNDLKDKAKAEFDKQKKDLEDKAKAEFDKQKKEAEDRAKKEAEARVKAEVDKAKKNAEKKAKDALNGFFKK